MNPVDGRGVYLPSTPPAGDVALAGLHIWKANDAIVEVLRDSGALLAHRDARAQLSALLAPQDAGGVPRHAAVVHLDGAGRPAPRRAGGDRQRAAGCPTGARRASTAWSKAARTGASRASAPGACRSRCSSTAKPASRIRASPTLMRAGGRPRRAATASMPGTRSIAAELLGAEAPQLRQGHRHPRCLVRFRRHPRMRARAASGRRPAQAGRPVPRRLRPASRLVPVARC